MKSAVACILLVCISLATATPTDNGQCKRIDPKQRVACDAKVRYGRVRCLRSGCCFDKTIPDAMRCFKPNETKNGVEIESAGSHVNLRSAFFPVSLSSESKDKSTLRSCVATPSERVDCGWSSISQKVCEARGCCYDRSAKDGPACYQPESLLIGRRARKVLECAWECSRQPWRKIAQGYSRCSTNAFCWMEIVGQSSGTCLAACKTGQQVDQFLANVSHCLRLDAKVSRDVQRKCDTDLPCWIDTFGFKAVTCFKQYEASAPVIKIEIPAESENAEEEEQVEKKEVRLPIPAIDQDPNEPEKPEGWQEVEVEEVGEEEATPTSEVEILRTDINVERSVIGQVENRVPPPAEGAQEQAFDESNYD